MSLRGFVRLWIFLTAVFAYESLMLNAQPNLSILKFLQVNGALSKDLDLNPASGKTISLWLGWLGIGTMLLTNLYIIRKRFSLFKGIGKLPDWLDFHIFCGLLGPTFIFFHTNFKIGGLVAVSFWSMVVSFASGVVGRYFYMQIVGQKADLERLLRSWDQQIQFHGRGLTPAAAESNRTLVLALVGAGPSVSSQASVTESVVNSLWGDLKLRFGMSSQLKRLPRNLRHALIGYAVTRRRILYLEQFRQVMGYWHTFHMPFAVFMYVVAAIHIATALLLQV